MTSQRPIDVLIAGAGPTGSALAIDLARRGVDVRIVDKSPHSFEGSRAKGIQPRTLEVLDDLGAAAAVVAGGSTYPLLGIHVGPLVIPWRMFQHRAPSAEVPYPNTWLVPQFRTDSALHARLGELGRSVEFGTEVTDFSQGLATVTATLSSPAGVEEVTARYLVGADGGASTIRAKLGIGFVGKTDEQDRILIVDAVTEGLSRNRWHVWPGVRGRFVGACPLPQSELFQWMIRLAPGEEVPSDLSEINRVIRARTGARDLELHEATWRSVFRPNIRLAEDYRRGRVFLAGDAAHVHTPAGAQGLNTGVQDAYNLGWKLGQVIAGADDRLLDTYEAERQVVAAGVLGLSTRKYRAIGKLDTASIKRGKDEQQLTVNYHGGPLALGGGRTARLRVGDRAPDAPLVDAQGQMIRLFDVFRGPHFTGVAFGEQAAQALVNLGWPSRGAALKRVVVNAASSSADLILTDRRGAFSRIYGLSEDTLLIVRPDGYLAGITAPGTAAPWSVSSLLAPPVVDRRPVG